MIRTVSACLVSLVLGLTPAGSDAQEGLALQVTAADSSVTLFDLAALDDLPQESFVTGTIWTDGRSRFSGVPLAALLDSTGIAATARQIELVALNDYRIEIPVDELDQDAPIIATRIDGEAVPVREKGPFWLVYPYDRDARYRTETTFARSIWQLTQVNAAH